MTEDGFLQEIIAHPEDDAPRLVYADWLDDRGEADRAELIRLQIEVARIERANPRGPRMSQVEVQGRRWAVALHLCGDSHEWSDDARARPLRDRAWDLVRQHCEAWGAPFRNRASSHSYRRGLVEEVSAPARKLLTNAATWFRLAPFRALAISNAGGLLGRVTAMPELARLSELRLFRAQLTDEDARALAASPHLAGLTTLDLRYNRISLLGACLLADSPHLRRLAFLDLYGNWIGPDGVVVLRQRFGDRVRP
jgi:uncharacterized protein (TIGR02996 family)